jgi:site-specific recombinase XerD
VSVRVSQSVARSLANLLASLRSAHSRRSYAAAWAAYATWAKRRKLDPRKARPRDVAAYITALQAGKSAGSCGHALSVIRSVYGAFVRDEIMDSNPARELKPPRNAGTRRTPWLTEEQTRILFAAAAADQSWRGRRDHLALCLLFGLSKRRAEVARIQVEDFHKNAIEGIVKGGKHIIVGVPAWVLQAVGEWRTFAGISSGPLLPCSENNANAMTGDMIYNSVKRAAIKAGLPKDRVKPHGLRRTFATLLDELGTDVHMVQTAMAHSSVATTEGYQMESRAARQAPGDALADIAGFNK